MGFPYAPSVRRSLLPFVFVTLAACAGQPEPATQPTSSPTPDATAEPSPEGVTPPPGPESCRDETTGGAEVRIRANDNVFSPGCLIVLGGQSLELRNEGSSLHNFTIDGTDVDLDLPPGGEPTRTEAIGGAVAAGTYGFYCSYHRSLGMDGEITVTDAG